MADDTTDVPDSPVLQDFAKAIASEFLKKENLEKVAVTLRDSLAELIKILFATGTVVASEAVGPAVEGIVSGERVAEGSYQRMAATVLSGLFNTPIDAGDIGIFGNAERGAQKIGDAVLRGMGTPHSPIEPSDENAKRFIAMMGNLAVEGWLNGVIFEQLSKIETFELAGSERFAELKDVLISAFGLSRLSRRVFGPYVDTNVVLPFKWFVNKTYRPTLLSPAAAAKQVLRGRKESDRFFEETARAGYDDEDAESILNAARQKLSIDDWLFLERYGDVSTPEVDAALADLGCDDVTRDYVRRLDFEKRKAKSQVDLFDATADAYIDGLVPETSFLFALTQAYDNVDEREGRRQVVEARKVARRKRLSKADIEDAVKRKLLAIQDYRDWLAVEGYDEQSATVLELMLQSEIRGAEAAATEKARIAAERAATAQQKTADAAKRRADLEARQAAAVPPLSDIKTAVLRGIVPIDRYRQSLVDRGYKPDDVTFLMSMLAQDVQTRQQQEAARTHATPASNAPHINLADVERAVLDGILSTAEYDRRLTAAGYSANDRQLMVALLQAKLDDQKSAAAVTSTAADTLTKKGLSLAQAEKAVQLGVWSVEQLRAFLAQSGLDDVAVATIAASVQAQLDQADAAQTTRNSTAQSLSSRGISLDKLEQAVLAGVSTLDDYRRRLLSLQFDADSVETLVALLSTKLAARTQAKALQQDAAARSASKRISLGDVERAVILGNTTPDVYRQYLADLGYDDNDRAILYANLISDLQAARAVDAQRQQLDAAAPDDAAALSVLEQDVIAGDKTITDYRDALAVRGLAPADVDALVARLQTQVDAARAAEQLAATVDADLVARKSLTLAQWHDAVKAELRTIDDYRAFLSTLYTPADVDVLVSLLQQQLDREAAKGK